MGSSIDEASKLLDFNQQIDLSMLDRVVNMMYHGIGEEQKYAQQILTTLKEHTEAWTRVDAILEYSQNTQTKYYALQILEQVIKTRWKSLPDVQCEGIKKFIVQLIIKTSSNAELLEQQKLYLNKLNVILVQILKRDWPKKWTSFISDIVGSSKTNESLCQNNMVILKLLSEEIFDFSIGNLTQTNAKHLKDNMCNEFSLIFTLCQFVMENSINANLINATLETLLRFLNWIPLGYIFETDLIQTLTGKFLPVPSFRNITLKCLTEIGGVTVKNYDERFAYLFQSTMQQLEAMVPLTVNIRQAYSSGTDREQQFIQNLAMFLCIFLKEHGTLVEKELDKQLLSNALEYLALISEVDDMEIFKICLEYWNSLAAELYRESPTIPIQTQIRFQRPTQMIGPRRQFYSTLLSRIRQIMISRMAKPEEVLIVENENGEVVREFMKDTDSIHLYKNMRESLVYLTHLDCQDTEIIMTKKLTAQVNGIEWSWKNLNTLCWAIGSISGAMHEEDEKRFIVTVIKDLLGLCEQKKGKDNKAIIASNIMYVVGQYPRFLRAHWKFLKTVVNKLFEFMHETHDGVQDMACDTFIKIAQKCRRHFVTVQMGEVLPFIEEILNNTSTIICDLQPQQVHTFYEAVGYMISAQSDQILQEQLIVKYMHLPNQVWDEIISQASINVDVLRDMDAIKQLCSILKTNVRACKALQHPYSNQLGRIYLDMLNIYKVMSSNITQAISLNGEMVTKQPLIKGMRVIKKESLKLIQNWIQSSTDNKLVLDNFIPPLLDAILNDYKSTIVQSSREPEVISTMTIVINKLEGMIITHINIIFDTLFDCTLEMITKDFHEYPEYRISFYQMIQILKRDWPKKWTSFISDIVGSSKTNESLCQNNMVILKLLSEEIFDFSIGNLTQTNAKHLKDNMCNEFSLIFTLCQFVMENSINANLINATLETLLRFLNWIPLGYIFETDLIQTLTGKFLPVPSFRNITLKCLTEIGGVTVKNYDERFAYLFQSTMQQLEAMVPLTVNIRQAYSSGTDREQQFIQNLAMFLCIFLKEHGTLVEKELDKQLLSNALEYLALISEVDDMEIFKICLEYWNSLAAELYRESPTIPIQTQIRFQRPTQMIGPRRQFYSTLLSRIRQIMISRMAKPEEVLIVENENGEVVREFMKDTDSIHLYKNMRESLVYLTHLDCQDTEIIMTKKLTAQVNGIEWSWKNLNTLCWAIGSISGAMHEEDEKRFIVTVIKDLLGLCEQKKGKDNKAIIASNIMYVVGQYPRFLRAHWKFLKTVVNKLFEFMHETHDGVQDMACDTFIKIAQKCRRHFVTVQMGEVLPFIEEILNNTSTIICDLQPQQVHTFYEAVGYMISAQSDQILQEQLIVKYMHLPNQVWDEIISQASINVDVLRDMDAIKQLCSILKTNVRACKALQHPYSNQLGRIYLDMLNIYKVMSSNITQAISLNGEMVTKQPLIKGMRVIKKESLKLIQNWIQSSTDNKLVLDNFIPPLLDAILNDYKSTIVQSSREPEVISTMTIVINKLEGMIITHINIIFDTLFDCTLEMITKDFHEYPEYRISFYQMIQAITHHCFTTLISITPAKFKLIMDSIFWACKHTMRNVAETGLDILFLLLQNISKTDSAQSFYFDYFNEIIHNILTVMTDTSHAAGLSMHSTILAYLFSIVEMGQVQIPLDKIGTVGFEAIANIQIVQEYVATLLKNAFPHLTPNQIKITVLGMFQLDQNVPAFKEHVKDFLVQIRDFTGEDDSDLFLEEREKALQTAEMEKRKQQMTVPGIINPHDIPEEMQD